MTLINLETLPKVLQWSKITNGGVKMAYRIDENECIACGACEPVCPVECISEVEDGKRRIDEDACIDCGSCAAECPVDCIEQA